jgi:predicted  nucleic acid-binding Zn-ribbon protein
MHLIQSIENLDIAIDTTNSFRDQVEKTENQQQNLRIQSELYTLEREFMCIRRRSESLNQRFQNEINLVNSSPINSSG